MPWLNRLEEAVSSIPDHVEVIVMGEEARRYVIDRYIGLMPFTDTEAAQAREEHPTLTTFMGFPVVPSSKYSSPTCVEIHYRDPLMRAAVQRVSW